MTLRADSALPSLRSERVFPAVRDALAACSRRGFRLIQFSVQSDHLHLIVEADDNVAFSRGLQGLAVRCARAVNRCARRRGRVWAHRYHGRALNTPREVRRALVYVLLNFRKHLRAAPGVDSRSSGPWFEGWRDCRDRPLRPPSLAGPCPVARPHTWLAATGWRRAGPLISCAETPARSR